MKVNKVGGKGNVLELEFKDATPAQVNTLRRLMTTEVPTLAIELCEFKNNTSALYDEMLALRFGLVPLTTDLSSYVLPSKEELDSGDFQARSSVKGTLKVKGPCSVLAKELTFKDPKVKPVYPDMIIATLLEGQEIEVEVTAVLGQGKTHTKWATGLVYYHEIDSKLADERHGGDGTKGTGHYYFKIESWGQLKPQEILTASIDQFNKMLKEFDSLLG